MKDLKIYFLSLFIPVFIFISCCNRDSNEINSVLGKPNPFQMLIDSVMLNNDSVIGIILHVESPDLKISWAGASGFDRIEKKSRLKAN